MDGLAGQSTNVSHGLWLELNSTVQTQSGRISLDGHNHQDSGDFHHGFELGRGSKVQSESGHIDIEGTRTGSAVGSGQAVRLWTSEDEAPPSIVNGSGSISINAFGDPAVARLQLDRGVTIGGPEMTGYIDLLADDFRWWNDGTVQSSGRLRINSANGSDLTLGGSGTLNTLADDELAFLQDGFSRIEIGGGLNGPVIQNLKLDGAVFRDPVTLVAAQDVVLTGGTALTAATVSLTGDVSIQAPHSATIDGAVVLEDLSSLSLYGVSDGNTLTVNGSLDIGQNVDLYTEWVPSANDQPGTTHVLVDRRGGSGSFRHPGLGQKSRGTLFDGILHQETEYPRNITLTIPDFQPLATTVTKLGAVDQDGVTTIYGASAGGLLGQSVAAAGDINGDGLPDLLIGATNVDRDAATNAGAAYLMMGSTDWPSEFSIDSEDVEIAEILGADVNDTTGRFVAVADLNGDGYGDLIIPAFNGDSAGNLKAQSGEVAIIWGGSDLPSTIDLANPGDAGTIIYGADAHDLGMPPFSVPGVMKGSVR